MPEGRVPHGCVGVLGSGEVGRSLARAFRGAGHDVMIGTRDTEKPDLREWLTGDGAAIKAGTFAEAAAHGDLIAVAVPGDAAESVIAAAGGPGAFGGKVVIDVMNPLDFSAGFPPGLFVSGDDSLGERVQRALPDARVVKAFNIIGNAYFAHPSFPDGAPTMLIAGNDADAKGAVTGILADFGWQDTIDLGGIECSRELEAICSTWIKIAAKRGSFDHGFRVLTA